jgi:hypothetical protein
MGLGLARFIIFVRNHRDTHIHSSAACRLDHPDNSPEIDASAPILGILVLILPSFREYKVAFKTVVIRTGVDNRFLWRRRWSSD